ncbi:EthD protein [Nocardioidaceae bacterium Broad-1]|nr:EthD protein [Nocardioidaceae bacterium Broad-1]
MYNLILMASRPEDWSHEQFIEWWRGEHAEVTYPLPGLRRWLHTDVQVALEERSEGWDGVSILSFDSKEALDQALASEEWATAIKHVGRMRGHRIAVMGEERTMVG